MLLGVGFSSDPLAWSLGAALLVVGLSAVLPPLLRWALRAVPTGPRIARDGLETIRDQLAPRGLRLLVWPGGTSDARSVFSLRRVAGRDHVYIGSHALAELSALELRSVLAHELGHGRRAHGLWYLVLVVDFVAAAGLLARWLEPLGTNSTVTVLAGFSALVWGVFLPAIARRFELEADARAADAVGLAEYTRAVATTGARSPRRARRATFLHPSLERRLRNLDALARSDRSRRRFARASAAIRLALLGWLAALVAVLGAG